jgi:hypothetical protein
MKSRTTQTSSKFAARLAAAALFCLLFLAQSGFARTLDEYRASVAAANSAARNLIAYLDRAANNSSLKNIEYERETLENIRKNLPATEKIEWNGNLIETGNQWLDVRLKDFEKESVPVKRRAILTEIGERLSAIDAKITELQNASVSNRSKDEDKRKLAEILRRVEFQKPEVQEESWFDRLLRKIREWFNEKVPQPDLPQKAPEGLSAISFVLQLLVYAVVLGFIGFLIYRFAPFFADRFRRREKEDKGERIILGEKLAANEDSQTLFDEAEEMARSGNLRGAIRKGYIALLCELSDRKIIGLAQHKTNRDYLRDVRKKPPLYQNMNGLTNSFERHWYGFEQTNEADWEEFRENYRKTISS